MSGLLTRERRQSERAQPNDRRNGRRARVLLSGKVAYGAGFSLDCTIRDLSESGACISLPKNQAAPSALNLIVVRDGKVHQARTAWSRYPLVGLAFEASHDLSGPTTPAGLKPMRMLWAELAGRL